MKKPKQIQAQGEPVPAEELGWGALETAPDAPIDLIGATKAGLAGAARSATLGLSDVAMTSVPQMGSEIVTDPVTGEGVFRGIPGERLVEPETLKKLKEEHGTATTVGELAGLVLPSLGGVGAAVSAPAKAIMGLGELAEGAVQKAIANQVAGKLAGAGARGALESLVFNAGNNLSETLLGDENITAEKLLAHSGEALAFGGALGFGMTGAAMGLEKAAEKAKNSVGKLQEWIDSKLPNANPEKLEAYAQQASKDSGMAVDEIKNVFAPTPEGRKLRADIGSKDAVFQTPEQRDAIGKEFFSALEETDKAVRATKSRASREFRPKEIETLLTDVDASEGVRSAYGLADSVRSTIKEMADNPDIYRKGVVSEMTKIADGFEKRLIDLEKPADVFKLVNETKGLMDDNLKLWGRDTSGEAVRAVDKARSMRSQFKSNLETEELWGRAAARQSSYNDAMTTLIEAEGRLIGNGRKAGVFGTKVLKRGTPQFELNSKSINTFLAQTGASRSEVITRALNDYLEAARNYIDQAEASAGSAGAAFDRAGADSLIKKSREVADDAAKKLEFENKIRQSARADDIGYNAFTATAAGAMGAVMGGVPGAGFAMGAVKPVTEAIGALRAGTKDPIRLAKTLSKLESASVRATKAIDTAVEGMLGVAASGASAVSRSQAVRPFAAEGASILAHKFGDGDHKDNKQAFDYAKNMLAEVKANPMAVGDKMAKSLTKISEDAPKTKEAIVASQMRRMAFLADRLPKNPLAGYPGHDDWEPSTQDLNKFARYVRASADPMGVLKRISNGSVSTEDVEALQATSPALFEETKAKLLANADRFEKMPFNRRMALSLLFGVPLDPSLKPENIMASQSRFDSVAGQEKPGNANYRSGKPLTLGTSSQTPAERQMSRP